MATIIQQSAPLPIVGTIANPFATTITFTSITTATGASVAWANITSPTVVVTDQYGNAVNAPPVIVSPQNFELLLSWTAAQTTLISNYQGARWALEVTVEATGPFAILGGPLTFVPSSWPSASTSTAASLSVTVGTNNVALSVALGGATGVVDMTSDDGSIDFSPGGTGPIIDLSVVHIDGGNAFT